MNGVHSSAAARAWDTAAFSVAENTCSGAGGDTYKWVYGEAAIGFVTRGAFEYGSGPATMVCAPGSVVLGNRDEEFSVRHTDALGNSRLVTAFTEPFLREVADAIEVRDTRFARAVLPPGPRAARMLGWMRRLSEGVVSADEACFALASEGMRAAPASAPKRAPSAKDRERIRCAVNHIVAHYREPVTLQALADLVGLSRFQFVRTFSGIVGQSPNQYLINVRVRAGAQRLLETSEPIVDVAEAVGFHDVSHFFSCFRATFGCTPRHWRKGVH